MLAPFRPISSTGYLSWCPFLMRNMSSPRGPWAWSTGIRPEVSSWEPIIRFQLCARKSGRSTSPYRNEAVRAARALREVRGFTFRIHWYLFRSKVSFVVVKRRHSWSESRWTLQSRYGLPESKYVPKSWAITSPYRSAVMCSSSSTRGMHTRVCFPRAFVLFPNKVYVVVVKERHNWWVSCCTLQTRHQQPASNYQLAPETSFTVG